MTDPRVPDAPDDHLLDIDLGAVPESTETVRRASRRTRWVAGGLAVLLALGGVGFAVATMHKAVEIEVDGTSLAVGSFSGTVAEVLDEQGVTLGKHDEVLPGLDAALADGLGIEVLRAEAVSVVVDGAEETFWTTAAHAGEALQDFAASGRTASFVASRSAARAEIDLPVVVEQGRVQIRVDGRVLSTSLETTSTLDEVLTHAAITLGELDTVAVTAQENGTPVVTVTRIVKSQRTESEVVPHTSREVTSDAYYVNTSRVTTEGLDGQIDRVFDVTTVDGVETDVVLASETTVVEMVEEVVTVGSKPRPVVAAPSTSSSSSSSSGSSAGSASTVSGDVWAALAQCESGGNASIVSASGSYHGLYQFSVGTWQSVGGTGLPSQASAAEQTERAKILQARSGWGQWPSCARKLGLL